jgi:hypothetical protein
MINKYKSHKWIRKVIHSCTNDVQVSKCENLIRNFELLYNDKVLVHDLHLHITSKMVFNLSNIPNPLFQIDIMKGHYTNILDYIHETD